MLQRIELSSIPRFLRFRPDIPFARDDAGRYIPWIVALMVCLAGLLLCGGATLGTAVGQYSHSTSDSFSIQLPYQADGARESSAAIMAYLRRQRAVREAKIVDAGTLKSRVSPWLGKGEVLESIPLPTVIEAEVGSDVDMQKLTKEITALVPGTEIDSHEIWMGKFSRFADTLRLFVYIFAAFILGCLGLMMVFVSKAALKLHNKTVMLLHSIGADDRYIAHQFQVNAGLLALRGALPGVLLAALLLWLFETYTVHLNAPLLSGFALNLPHLGLLLALPFLCTFIATVSARIAVLRQLRAVL